jgi:D-3-phosphoglycerate dehydrogenase
MLGKIGTILGEANINIGNMNLGRREKAGEAMVVFSVDTPVDQETLDKITTACDARFIKAIRMQ